MAVSRTTNVAVLRIVGMLGLVALVAGCQTARPVSSQRLIQHAAVIDFSGLKRPEAVETVKVNCAIPQRWHTLPTKTTPLYTHEQWKSPSGHTGFGIAYIRLPFPIGTKMLVWLAKQEYSKKADDGKIIREWEDELGRSWFEAENTKYHVRGYAMTEGFQAWIIYFGYRNHYAIDPGEISLAARAVESIVPGITTVLPTTQPIAQAK